jgi:hypothetical protein
MNDTEPAVGQTIKPKHAGGRPPKLTPIEREQLYDAFKLYINRTPDPTVVGFVAYDPVPAKLYVTRENIKDWQEFSPLQKYCVEKQEAYLLQAGGVGKYNATLAIFRLKQPQHGYKDRVDSDITTNGNDVGTGITALQAEQLLKIRAARSDSQGV